MDYSKTLNLPKTDFPMRAQLPKREPEILRKWEEMDLEGKIRTSGKGKEKFILHDGPPYANGDIHIGHVLNKVLKDIIVKFKRMQGYDSSYVPGWDTHGLPIEHQIIKTKKIKRHETDVLEFRRMCRDYALKYVAIQREQFKRLGIGGDWDNPYLTLSPTFEARQIEVFGEMARKGYIYKGLKPVFWCPSCETALAEAEIEYNDRRSPSIYVKFPIKDDQGKFEDIENAFVLIWTTTPWTIPANYAIAVHPEFDYLLAEIGGDKLLFAVGLLEEALRVAGTTEYQVLKMFKGAELEDIVCYHPLYDRDSRFVLGDHVTLEQGTGCVHTAPGHGQDDYELGLKYNLPIFAPMDNKGVFTAEAKQFAGLGYADANKAVTEALEKEGLLLHMEFIKHQYPHCWRCKKPVLFRATEQWFASIEGFRQDVLQAIKDVRWIPAWGEDRMANMVIDRGDWCISRQRVWGVPIPIFYCRDCQEAIIEEKTIKSIAAIFQAEGSDAWFIKDSSELLPAGYTCRCGGKSFRKETDIMDVWFDSGSSHAAVCDVREELAWPADMYLEGNDQYRGWFQSSLLTAVATRGKAPYRITLAHGWVVDGNGKKMSKSQGNVIAPEKIIKEVGADVLRLWVSSADFKSDVRVSAAILKQLAEVYRKIRNTSRFLLGNCFDFDPVKDSLPYSELTELDRFALHRLQNLVQDVTNAYESYEYHHLFHAIHNFCVVDMSNFYLDVLKDRLYVSPSVSRSRRSAQTVMYEILTTLVKLMAPVLSFTAEEIWQHLPKKEAESVQLVSWPKLREEYLNQDLAKKWQAMLQVREKVTLFLEEMRQRKEIRSSLEARVEIYPGTEKVFKDLEGFRDDLAELFIVSECQLHPFSDNGEEIKIKIAKAAGEKCPRCWIYSEEISTDEDYPGLCPRCVSVVGEMRLRD